MKKIKNILIKINNHKLIIIVIFIIAGAFYWYELRPLKIYKKCTQREIDFMTDTEGPDLNVLNLVYSLCLGQNGIKR